MNLMCTRCKQRVAMIFVTRMDNARPVNEGYCLQCAKDLGIPQIKEMIDNLGVSEEDLEAMAGQLMDSIEPGEENAEEGESGFEPGGARSFPAFLQNFISGAVPGASPAEPDDSAIREKPGRDAVSDKPQKKAEKQKKYKYLDNYCENLTEKAAAGKIDRIVGRDREIYRVMQILNRRTKNNPCLIGEPGVGKTAIAEGIAQRLADGSAPPKVSEKKLYLLDLTALVAGTQFRGQFESRVKGLVEDIKQAGNVILFIDEVHNLIGAGDAEGSMNAANILKPALSRGEIQVIGATTFTEYRKHIEKDAALERRFQPVTVNEPSIDEAVEVLMGVKGYYELFHRVRVPEEVVRRAVTMSERYITDRYLPDKAIDLLDEACSCSTLENHDLTEYERLNRKLRKLREQEASMEQQTGEVDYAKLAAVKSEVLRVDAAVRELEPKALGREVTIDDLARVVELWTGIPASKIKESELKKVAHLADTLKTRIIGQDEAVDLVAAAVRRTRIQLSAKKRPASFIFVGPTGVGKTELVKQLSNELFQAADPLIRLDMSEFMEKHSVSRIIGSPPGYVGYDEAGQLTEKVRRKPYSVVLFDEIEKAHPDVLNILLQILDEGKITDAQGRVVSFENTVIVMTSNAGSNLRTATVGFGRAKDEATKERAEKALADFLRPEFLARVDEIVVFKSLTEENYQKIAALMLDELVEPLREREIRFNYDDAAVALIAKKAYGGKSGARDIRKVIRREVEDRLTLSVVEAYEAPPSLISLTAVEGELTLLTA